ncbi:MAG: carboxymuconolactone decarboxylase family protein [Fibrobacter sp.]|nr:carboxymuconolactone decarboxylase family protein [Fibrobacter sp.]
MKKGIIMGLLGLGALLAACDCCPQGETKALSQDKELRAVMDNFIGSEVPEATPLVEKREAELIRLVSLTVQQSNALLQEEVGVALDKGLSPEEILEAIYQCAPYSGFPRAVDAVEIARGVFKAKNVKVDESRATVNAETRLQAGADAQGTLFTSAYAEAAKAGKQNMPTIQYFLSSNCFGDYYTRKGLDLNTRELLTMAILVNLGTEPQLKAHISANLKIRTAEYVEQAIYNCLPYCGYPRTLNALRLLKEAAAEATATKDNKIMDQAAFDKQNVFGKGDPNVNYAKYFIGNSYLKAITDRESGFPMANVTFEPGTRNNWHIHHAKKGGGQVLIVTAGSGWYQLEGKPAVSLNPGDAVVIPANVKHWHGAKKDSWFSHIAFEAPGEGMSNEWLEPVTDEEYNKL